MDRRFVMNRGLKLPGRAVFVKLYRPAGGAGVRPRDLIGHALIGPSASHVRHAPTARALAASGRAASAGPLSPGRRRSASRAVAAQTLPWTLRRQPRAGRPARCRGPGLSAALATSSTRWRGCAPAVPSRRESVRPRCVLAGCGAGVAPGLPRRPPAHGRVAASTPHALPSRRLERAFGSGRMLEHLLHTPRVPPRGPSGPGTTSRPPDVVLP